MLNGKCILATSLYKAYERGSLCHCGFLRRFVPAFSRQTLPRPLLRGCHGCLLRASFALRSRHVLRCRLAAELAVCLAHGLEVFEHFRRHPFGHAAMVAANEGKV